MSFREACSLGSKAKQCSFHSQARRRRLTRAQKDGNVRSWLLTNSFVLDCLRIGLQDESQMSLRRGLRLKDIKLKWNISTFRDSHLWHVGGTGMCMSCRASSLE